MTSIALFPLNIVLFPDGPLPLRIFETRYLDMVGRCLRGTQEFGVALIRHGSEVGPAETCEVGTSAMITDLSLIHISAMMLVAWPVCEADATCCTGLYSVAV